LFDEHNKIRKDPKYFIPELKEMLDKFDGFLLKRDGQVTLRTKEGVEAVKEAIDHLGK
jgi:hypothetical protein